MFFYSCRTPCYPLCLLHDSFYFRPELLPNAPIQGIFKDPSWSGALYYYKYPKYPDVSEEGAIHPLEMTGLPVEAWMKFHPLGIGYWAPSRTLFVVNHGPPGPTIEVFKVNKQVTAVTHVKTMTHDLLHAPNSVVPISEDEILVTNDHRWTPEDSKIRNVLETYLAYPGGSVVHVNLRTNQTQKLVNLPFANGIAVLNKTMLAVASTNTPSVHIYNIVSTPNSTISLKQKQKISIPFFVDNLKTDSSGHLLMAGHPHSPSLSKVARTNHEYAFGETTGMGGGWVDGGLPDNGKPVEERFRAPSWVAEWDGNSKGKLKDIYIGKEYGTSTTFVKDAGRGIGIVVGLYERGVFVGKV
jgi:arylesterase/paraoxonase